MSKNKSKNIEDIITSIKINDKLNYLIKYKGIKTPIFVEEDQLSTYEKNLYQALLNRKRKNSDSLSENMNIKNEEEENDDDNDNNDDNDDNDDEDNHNLSITSSYHSIPKKETKKKKNKNEIKNVKRNKKENNKENKDRNKINEIFNGKNKMKYYSEKSENKNEIKKNKKFERPGVLLEDEPLRILNVGYKDINDKTLYSLVEWKQQPNIRILDSIIENKKIKQTCPELLIDYYESKIVFLE